MNKEEKKFIERIENTFYENRGKGIKHFQKVTLYEEGITDILKLLNFVEKQQKKLEQKESILDKVTEYCKRFEYETEPIGDDDYLTERALVCEEILNIVEGGRNGN